MKRRPDRADEPESRPVADAEPTARPEPNEAQNAPGLRNKMLQERMDQFIPGWPHELDLA